MKNPLSGKMTSEELEGTLAFTSGCPSSPETTRLPRPTSSLPSRAAASVWTIFQGPSAASALKMQGKPKWETPFLPGSRGSLTASAPRETRERAFLQTLPEYGTIVAGASRGQRAKPGAPGRNAATQMPRQRACPRGRPPGSHASFVASVLGAPAPDGHGVRKPWHPQPGWTARVDPLPSWKTTWLPVLVFCGAVTNRCEPGS